jgi:hypothetical protein
MKNVSGWLMLVFAFLAVVLANVARAYGSRVLFDFGLVALGGVFVVFMLWRADPKAFTLASLCRAAVLIGMASAAAQFLAPVFHPGLLAIWFGVAAAGVIGLLWEGRLRSRLAGYESDAGKGPLAT